MGILELIIGMLVIPAVLIFGLAFIRNYIYIRRAQTQTIGALKREFRSVNVIQDVYDAQGGPEGFVLDESMADKGWVGIHLITNNKNLIIAHEILKCKPLIKYNQDVVYDLKERKYKARAHVD